MVLQARGGRARPTCPACGWVYYARNATGAALLLERDGKLLLSRRAHEPFKGGWALPAGFVEYGDSALETVVREAEEEVGLRVRAGELFGVYFGADDPRNVSHLIVYRVEGEGEPAPGDDVDAVGFFGPHELPENLVFESQRAAIADWLARRQREPS